MKTILKVIRTGDQKIRFETDLDLKKNPEAQKACKRNGGNFIDFPPGVGPSDVKS